MNSSFDYKGLLEQTLGIPFTSGNTIQVLKNGDRIFPAMLKAINQAKERVEFLTFVYWSGNIAREFARALANKAEEGVEVFVILDSLGAAKMPEELIDFMEKKGVQIEFFRPLTYWKIWKLDNRTHRKVLIGFTRLAGLRSFSKLSSFDFAVTVAVGSPIATTILAENPPLIQAIIALGVLYILQNVVAKLREVSPFISKLVDNQPTLLMNYRLMLYENLKATKVALMI